MSATRSSSVISSILYSTNLPAFQILFVSYGGQAVEIQVQILTSCRGGVKQAAAPLVGDDAQRVHRSRDLYLATLGIANGP